MDDELNSLPRFTCSGKIDLSKNRMVLPIEFMMDDQELSRFRDAPPRRDISLKPTTRILERAAGVEYPPIVHIKRPSRLSEHALAALSALSRHGLGHVVSLGGAVGLSHYLDHRPTHDVDAWWNPQATRQDRERVLAAVKEALSPFGQIKTREWGEVVSLDLLEGSKIVFSFQVAARPVQLEPSASAGWVDVDLDSLPDLLAGKMVALVERGAPRDFLDIHKACQAGVTTPRECWVLWSRRQAGAGSQDDTRRARLAVETHLQRIAKHRPLESIDDSARRQEADAVRRWFGTEFLDAIPG